uniref:SJCHGC07912 protein n=1 Tax=Schistosoma japonicum TaxID=6182 RepID=Q5DFI9_SCHJA|nr:SJCHGC07912 protein [Schistosoma japonicum]
MHARTASKSFLSERNDEGNDTESFIPGNSSKIFKNVQNLRFVQEKALPDLFLMHEFLHANTIWIRELIRSQRDCYKNISIKTDPWLQLDEAFNSNANITLIDSIEEINWDKICCINVGLQEL